MHHFQVGHVVTVKFLPRDELKQAFKVIRCMPPDETGTPQYRLRGVMDDRERFARETEIVTHELALAGGA